jgi:glycosyltransferase involved in cell wall biosynthesis
MENKFYLVVKILFNWSVFRKMMPELYKEKVIFDKAKLAVWLKGLAESNVIMNSKSIHRIGRLLLPDDVCYFYWGKWSNIISVFWKGRCHLVSRFHGTGDLWEDIYNEYFPLRKKVLKALDFAIFISKSGEHYFQQKYPGCKTLYSPLGTVSVGVPLPKKDEIVRVVSCSTIIALKRVYLIFRSLNLLDDLQIEWTHIGGAIVGDDSLYKELNNEIAADKKEHLKVNLVGSLPHDKVMEYYAEHPFDIFINMSTSEGVPVSIMEALSCNIAIVATNVGGTCEVVTPETGVLVSPNPTEQEVAKAIRKCLKTNLAPRKYWETHFDADNNYNSFAQFLSSL